MADAIGPPVAFRDGVITTPHIASGILGGITRQTVIDLCRAEGMEVREEFMTLYDLFAADESFLTGTAAEVIPLVTVDTKKIGCGTPGEITQRVITMFRKETENGTAF